MLHSDCVTDWLPPVSAITLRQETELDCLCTGDTPGHARPRVRGPSDQNKTIHLSLAAVGLKTNNTLLSLPSQGLGQTIISQLEPAASKIKSDWPAITSLARTRVVHTEQDWWFFNANFHIRNSIHIQDWRLAVSGDNKDI